MMNLLVLLEPNGSHIGGWRHPDAYAHNVMNLQNIVEIAKLAERGKIDAIFLADGNGVRDMEKPELFAASSPTARPTGFEPLTLFSAVAQHTKHVGFLSTATTTFEQPYLLARKFLSLDHLSGGRAGWNVVTTQYEADARNFGFEDHMGRNERYERAEEFVRIVKGLWDSWADDAFIADKESGRFLRPDRVRRLNHAGKHFKVQGPLSVMRSAQAYPVICAAGQSEGGKTFAARMSDMMFAASDDKDVVLREYRDVKERVAKEGRDPASFKFIPSVATFIGKTADEAERLFDECKALISPVIGVDYLSTKVVHDLRNYPLDAAFPDIRGDIVGGTSARTLTIELALREKLTVRQVYERFLSSPGGLVMKGTASSVADQMQDWYESGACDGFMLAAPVMPRSLIDIVEMLIPELQRRGLTKKEYAGTTLRENMGMALPPNPYFA